MLDGGDGGKGEEAVESLFTSFLAPSVPGQRSSTSLGGVIGRASLTPENWSISAIFSIASSRPLYKFARRPFFSSAIVGMPRELFKRKSPIPEELQSRLCYTMHKCAPETPFPHSLPSSSQHREQLWIPIRTRRQCITTSMFISNLPYACHHSQVTSIILGRNGRSPIRLN